MSHYDCRHCGTWLCNGECRTKKSPEELERVAAESRRQTASSHRFILNEEAKRLKKIADAEEFFRHHDELGNPLKVDLVA
ncbi:hypothetical protein OTK49_21485 [Vibrio coralliirubri]|uniref:hypothetical protein n=1 Tax=Vibrio coralliirubri TaxID=1516159 RepID=UPI002283825C|nr:hypothetical protein [Vibrio coralliirubri]MCY9865095.1 hypothetical protein [Vibrio coralliirubri]